MIPRIRIGVVGTGGVATLIHLPTLSLLDDIFEICAVCDPDTERARSAARRHNVSHFFTRIENMIDEVEIDAVAVMSPEHIRAIDYALSSNLHVFTEKPISLNYENSVQLATKASSRNLVLAVGLMRTYDPALRRLYSEVPVESIRSAHFCKSDGSDCMFRNLLLPHGMEPYQLTASLDGEHNDLIGRQLRAAQLLLWNGIHLLSAIVLGFGSVTAASTHLGRAEDSLLCVFRGRNGQTIVLDISESGVPLYYERIHLNSRERLGSLELSSPYVVPTTSRVTISSSDQIPGNHTVDEYSEHIFRRMWEEFHLSVVSLTPGGNRRSTTLDLGLRAEALALEAIRLLDA